MAEQVTEPDLSLHIGKPSAQLEQEQMSLSNGGKAKRPLSFYMTFLALSICVLLVSLDATALSVAVPVSDKAIRESAMVGVAVKHRRVRSPKAFYRTR